METSLDIFLRTQKLDFPIDIHDLIKQYYVWGKSNKIKLVTRTENLFDSHFDRHGLVCVASGKKSLIMPEKDFKILHRI
jgi:hypothetical protein